MNVRIVLVAAGVALVVAFALVAMRAWNSWPPLGRYRLRRNEAAMKATVRQYLEGRLSLDAASVEVGGRMRKEMYLGWALSDEDGNTMTAIGPQLTPSGYSADDPRIVELTQRSFVEFMGGREAFERAQEKHRRWMQERHPDRSSPSQ